MLNPEIETVDIKSRRGRAKFVQVIYNLSKNFKNWVPGLRILELDLINPSKNPFLRDNDAEYFIVKSGGVAVGRCALFEPGYWPEQKDTAHFGFVDFIDDREVSDLLFKKLKDIAMKRGVKRLIGPLNPNINYSVGVMTKGIESPNCIMMNYNPLYYSEHFKMNDFQILKTFTTWKLNEATLSYNDRFEKIAGRIKKNKDLTIREGVMRDFQNELKIFYKLYVECFMGHWGFVPPSWEEFKFIAGDLKWVIKSKLALIAEYRGKPVGFVLCIPNFNELLKSNKSGKLFPFSWLQLLFKRNSIRGVRVMITGVLPDYRNLGLHVLLFDTLAKNILETGFEGAELGWVIEGNQQLQNSIKEMGAKPSKVYDLFKFDFSQGLTA